MSDTQAERAVAKMAFVAAVKSFAMVAGESKILDQADEGRRTEIIEKLNIVMPGGGFFYMLRKAYLEYGEQRTDEFLTNLVNEYEALLFLNNNKPQ